MKYVLPLVVLVSVLAVAQEVPRYELSTGYAYGDVDYPTTTAYGLSPRGWVGSFSANLRRWAALEAEAGGQYQNETFSLGSVPYSMNAGFYSFLAGPRVAYRRGRTSPFVHTLFGLARTIAYDKASVNASTGTAFFPYENGLGALIGGGLDYRVNRRISMRTQADYFVTQPNGGLGGVTQNNFRLVAGIVFNFGGMTGYSMAKDRSQPPAPAAAAAPSPTESYQLQPRPQSETMSAADDSKGVTPGPAAAAQAEPPASESAPQPPVTSWSASQKSKMAEPEPEDSAPAAGITAAPAAPETPATATTEPAAAQQPAPATAGAQPSPAQSQPAVVESFPATPRVVTTQSGPAGAVVTASPAMPHVVTTVATPASQPAVMTSAPSTPAVVSTATPAPPANSAPAATPMSAPGTAGVYPPPAAQVPAAQAAAKPAASAPAPAAVEIAPPQQDTVIAGYDPSSVSSQPTEEPLGDVARRYRAEKKRRQQLEKEHHAAQAPLAP